MKLPNFDLFGFSSDAAEPDEKKDLPKFTEQVKEFKNKIKTKFKQKNKGAIVVTILIAILTLYLAGVFTTFVRMFCSLSNGISNIIKPSFNPATAFLSLLDIKYSIWGLLVILILIAMILYWYIRNHITLGTYTVEERGGAMFQKQTQDASLGSAREMTEEELNDEFLVISKSELKKHNPGTIIYGILPNTDKYVLQKPKPINAAANWAPNLSTFVCGDSGSRKTSNFIITLLYQLMRSKRNIICPDISGEVFKLTYNFFKNNGYKIRVLNTKSPEHSDTWNFIGSVGQNLDLAKTVTQTIQQATELPNSHSDEFFTRGMNTLLPALILYVNDESSGYENSIKGIIKLITENKTVDKLDKLFEPLDKNSEAKIQYTLFEVSPVKENFLSNLAQRLDLFVSRGISRICSNDGINLIDDLGKEGPPTIIYVITNKTYGFISSLFLSSAAQLLEEYSNKNIKDNVLPNSLYFVYEEFLNQGYVPNMVYNMQNLRKYQIYFFLIVQSIPSFEEIYGENEADAILENCRYKLLFGAGGPRTAEKFEKFCGPTTARTRMTATSSPIIKTYDQVREGIQQRSLYDYNELMTFDINEYLLFTTHAYPIKLMKPYYKFIPGMENIEEAFFMDYTPSAKVKDSDEQDMQNNAEIDNAADSATNEITENKSVNDNKTEQNTVENSKEKHKKKVARRTIDNTDNYEYNFLKNTKYRERLPENEAETYVNPSDGKRYFKREDSHGKPLLAYKLVYDIDSYDVTVNGEIPENRFVTYHSRVNLIELREKCKLNKPGFILEGWKMIKVLDNQVKTYLYAKNQPLNISIPKSDVIISPIFKAIPGAAENEQNEQSDNADKANNNNVPIAAEIKNTKNGDITL